MRQSLVFADEGDFGIVRVAAQTSFGDDTTRRVIALSESDYPGVSKVATSEVVRFV